MDFTWMEEKPRLKKVKDWINFRHRAGDLLCWLPKTGLVQRPRNRKPGISVYMCVKNESQWIEPTLRSLAPFVEQFSIVDNGSTDDTVEIIKKVAEELSLDCVVESLSDADFGKVCDLALQNTTCSWVLRWAGDIIARSQGDDSFKKIRDFALSLDDDIFYVIYFPHIQLDGDLYHMDPNNPIHYEDYLATWSPRLSHTHEGRFRELRYPLYYKRLYLWELESFHLWGLDSPENIITRKYWADWRKHNDFQQYSTLISYVDDRIREEYNTSSLTEAGALYIRERLRNHIPYDMECYRDYPEHLKPYLKNFPLRIVYRDGVIAGRSDVMDILDRLDEQKKRMSVDVIVPTRNREEFCVDTVRKLLEQNYPNYRIIICDQSDNPSEQLRKLSVSNERLLYHCAKTRGLPAGRNEALALSSSDIVIFVDDDVIPEPGFIEGHVCAYINDTIGATAGKIIEKRPSMMKPVPYGKIGTINYWTGDIKRGFVTDSFLDVDSAQGCNMSFRRTVLLDAGGFDERFGGTALLEETDAVLTVRKLGNTVRYTPNASLTHLASSAGGCRLPDIIDEIYWYGHNSTLIFLKHFPRYVFPVWFLVRIGKFLRDCVRMKSLIPLFKGLQSMFNGYRTYRTSRSANNLPKD